MSSKDKKKKSKESLTEAVKKLISSLPPDQQVETVLSKYTELVEENKNLQSNCRSLEKSTQQAQKDKDRVEVEHSKAVLTRSRLESLCRELQRQNKIIKDDNMTRLKEEEERRKDVSNQFNSTLSEISNLMEENSQNNSKLREENSKMASRLQDLVKQHEIREDHVEKIIKQRELETQLAEAKFAKFQYEITEQKEKVLIERKQLLEEMSTLQNKLQEKSLNEITLRTQLNSYTEKFNGLQGTLEKSNQIFNGFKKEIDDMNKLIKKLEKETKTWKEKYERANVALYQMFNDRTQMEAKIESQTKQNTQLQSLCRALQQQTKELRTQLKLTDNTESSSIPSTKDEESDKPVQNGNDVVLVKDIDTKSDGDNKDNSSVVQEIQNTDPETNTAVPVAETVSLNNSSREDATHSNQADGTTPVQDATQSNQANASTLVQAVQSTTEENITESQSFQSVIMDNNPSENMDNNPAQNIDNNPLKANSTDSNTQSLNGGMDKLAIKGENEPSTNGDLDLTGKCGSDTDMEAVD